MINFIKRNSVVILLLSLLYFVSSIFFGVDFSDSFYHLSNAKSQSGLQINFFKLLSVYVMKFFLWLAPDHVVLFRAFNILIVICGFLMPLLLFKKYDKNTKRLLVALLLVLYSPFVSNIFGYDTISAFLVLLTYSVFFKFYFSSNNKYLIFILGIVSALAILSRFPNILIVMTLSLGIYFKENKNVQRRIVDVFKFLTTICIVLFICYIANYGNFQNLFDSQTISESHSISHLLDNYISHFLYILFYGFFIALVLLALHSRNFFKNQLHFFIFIILIIGISYALAVDNIIFSSYNKSLTLFYTALSMLIIVLAFFDTLPIKQKICITSSKALRETFNQVMVKTPEIFRNLIFFLVTASFFFINASGSDTGLMKSVKSLPILILMFFF